MRMHWHLRPWVLICLSVALTVAAAALVVWPGRVATVAMPVPVSPGDGEVAWLYQATNSAAWERFVTAVDLAIQRRISSGDELGLRLDTANAFPQQTTAVPELSVTGPGGKKLWIRWYKLTSDLDTTKWVSALLARKSAPLAIIGGSTSNAAIDLAESLRQCADPLKLGKNAPLLFLTTATADDQPGPTPTPLPSIYPDRTFRFCFTNRQMADAVTAFIWQSDDLRPDADPLFLTHWQDDPYSMDLNKRFVGALQRPAATAAVRDWASLAGFATGGGSPINLSRVLLGEFRLDTPVSAWIPYSIGTFDRPNRWEVEEAGKLMRAKLESYPEQRRALLVIPAASQPARRFLLALRRASPSEARRFVVATGDAIAFNTIYRDRNVAWPIQDLPFPLVFFCHRNPVDPRAGFPQGEVGHPDPRGKLKNTAGTEDLLLYLDIVDSIIQSCARNGPTKLAWTVPPDAAALAEGLRQIRWQANEDHVAYAATGPILFDQDGNRQSGTGEHVVYLRPLYRGKAILAEAMIEVWAWQTDLETGQRFWHRQEVLPVFYDGYQEEEI